ncbi:hypothetical protein [Microcoleus sp.]|uniref:hypothetical protein n=1 Tax=Microcoleus sp. TaxID=44472 RepID=UPI003526147A
MTIFDVDFLIIPSVEFDRCCHAEIIGRSHFRKKRAIALGKKKQLRYTQGIMKLL